LEENEEKSGESDPFPFFGCIHPLKQTLRKICYLREAIKNVSLPDGKRISPCLADGKLIAERMNGP
jgi:hypothetical protein